MKNYLIVVFLMLLSCSCSVTKNVNFSGRHVSFCHNLGFPELVADFNKDYTFQYKYVHDPDTISGKWEVKNDTLFLFSKTFEKKTVSLTKLVDFIVATPDSTDEPEVNNGQYTEIDNMDVYLIRGKYLYRLTKTGFTKDCPLIRVKRF